MYAIVEIAGQQFKVEKTVRFMFTDWQPKKALR